MRFLRTIERQELNELCKNLLAAIAGAEDEYKVSIEDANKQKEDGEITTEFHKRKIGEATQKLETSYRDACRLYAPRFDELIRKLNILADSVPDAEITEDEMRALTALQGMSEGTVTQGALNAALTHWHGSQTIMEAFQALARTNLLAVPPVKPLTNHLTASDIKKIADDIKSTASMYFEARKSAAGSYFGAEEFVNAAMRGKSGSEMEKMANSMFNPFDFDGDANKLFEFDALCDRVEIG